ncbi:hypothetical protein FW774_06785 [Pedobacter sp. BS3]|uniref:hypothetical protein n=1 Tax=Pedobacter sp. BS3 TaxID=2567937 RepID=UPI0011ED5B62|nr:hypothetical protein [Pedobacter sp. BS3]TZF84682.1 hypothetical protein FW774_06785 [Pedobacter sp. BS3]
MENIKIISGSTADEIWDQIVADWNADAGLLEYQALIKHQNHEIQFIVDIDPGGGFEGGYELTRFVSQIKPRSDFRFAIHKHDLIDDIGKFFGMEDVEIGYPEFDKKFIIKTNDALRVKKLLAGDEIRAVLMEYDDFILEINHQHVHHEKKAFLELRFENNVPGVDKLRRIFRAYTDMLNRLDA